MRADLFQFIKYGFVGGIGTMLHLVLIMFLVEVFHFEPLTATIIGYALIITLTYYINLRWTFGVVNNTRIYFLRYCITSLLGLLINLILMYFIVYIFHIVYLVGQLLSVIVVPIFNFILNKRWTFGEKDIETK
ncbi:GtrA family protein [Paenibacillus sp. EKM202P]|uniref:GtrA family protein n=1 Tax=unclassified Paenibacillus TaxID=185978 RepID=UPI0013ECAFF5|nr:GtrA family protein [Paenibacillus sp. EKM202P]KAF6573477.1 GtrA family protein [Paenibacillus sp. EKM207P]